MEDSKPGGSADHFDDIVIASLAALGRDMLYRDGEYYIILVLPRSLLTEMQLKGLCWGPLDGDLHARFTDRDAFVDEDAPDNPEIPGVSLEHEVYMMTSRVLGQMSSILKTWVDAETAKWPTQGPAYRNLFIARAYEYLRRRLQTLPQHCVICDTKHEEGVPRWRPTACRDKECLLAARKFLCHDSLSWLYERGEAASLELGMFWAAIRAPQPRRSLLLDPHWFGLPDLGEPLGQLGPAQSLGGDPPGDRWDEIAGVMVKLPRRDSLPDDPLRLKQHFDARHPELFNLARTVLNNPLGFLFEVRDEAFMETLKRAHISHAFLFLPHD
jgi:hypothetical protein